MNTRFRQIIIQFVPRFVPRFAFCYPLFHRHINSWHAFCFMAMLMKRINTAILIAQSYIAPRLKTEPTQVAFEMRDIPVFTRPACAQGTNTLFTPLLQGTRTLGG